jgi:gentisate 1,2-dioxygenase
MTVPPFSRSAPPSGQPSSEATADVPSALERFERQLHAHHLAPLWRVLRTLTPREPRTVGVPARWAAARLREQLLAAGALISAAEAERRVLVLENPALAGESRITAGLYAGVQLVLPGETAPSHRHSAAALRFVLEGAGAYTTIGGRRIPMHRGDLVITPSWSYHEHGNSGHQPVMWLDGLDVPIVNALNVAFSEEDTRAARPGPQPLAKSADSPHPSCEGTDLASVYFPVERTLEALAALCRNEPRDAHCGWRLEFTRPGGGAPTPTLGAAMQRLPAGFAGRRMRSTDGSVLAVLSGRGRIDFADRSYPLEPNDIVVVPGWTWHALGADHELTLFSFCDRPLQRHLSLWRDQRA